MTQQCKFYNHCLQFEQLLFFYSTNIAILIFLEISGTSRPPSRGPAPLALPQRITPKSPMTCPEPEQ